MDESDYDALRETMTKRGQDVHRMREETTAQLEKAAMLVGISTVMQWAIEWESAQEA
jgi:hypothetical protein